MLAARSIQTILKAVMDAFLLLQTVLLNKQESFSDLSKLRARDINSSKALSGVSSQFQGPNLFFV